MGGEDGVEDGFYMRGLGKGGEDCGLFGARSVWIVGGICCTGCSKAGENLFRGLALMYRYIEIMRRA